MYKIEFSTNDPTRPPLVLEEITDGQSLLEVALEHHVSVQHECGGMATCGTCYVQVNAGNSYLEFKSRREIHCLQKNNISGDEFRLACQCILLPGSGHLVVVVPESQK